MKVIFMNNSGFSKITAELTFLDYVSMHYPYEVWELSEFYDKKGTFQNIEQAQSIHSIDEFEKKLAEEVKNNQIVIVTNMVQAAYFKVYNIVKKWNIPVIDTQKNNFMSFLERKSAFDFSIKMPLKTRVRRMLNSFYVIRYINKRIKYNGIKFDYFLSAYNFSPEEVNCLVKTHNVKYDEYLKNKETNNPFNKKYILFIDSATCYHPVDYRGEDPNFDAAHHLKQLNEYFDLLEKKFGLPVVISLHPCSVGYLTEDSFKGRRITYSETAKLIQHSEFVVSFFSTSLINVVLAGKPSLIITSKEIENSRRANQELCAFAFARMCGFSIDSLDNPNIPVPHVDAKKYMKFTNDYLVNSEKTMTSNGEMLVELLKSLEIKRGGRGEKQK